MRSDLSRSRPLLKENAPLMLKTLADKALLPRFTKNVSGLRFQFLVCTIWGPLPPSPVEVTPNTKVNTLGKRTQIKEQQTRKPYKQNGNASPHPTTNKPNHSPVRNKRTGPAPLAWKLTQRQTSRGRRRPPGRPGPTCSSSCSRLRTPHACSSSSRCCCTRRRWRSTCAASAPAAAWSRPTRCSRRCSTRATARRTPSGWSGCTSTC